MKFKTLAITIIACMLCFSVATAQPRGNRTEAQVKKMEEKVGLTVEQSAKVKAILQKMQEAMRTEFENSDADREARREAMTKRLQAADAEIEKLLTKEQKPKFEEYKKERQKERQERMRERQ